MTGLKPTKVQIGVVAFLALGALVMYHEYMYSRGRLYENAPPTGQTMGVNGQTDGSEVLRGQAGNRTQNVINGSSLGSSGVESGDDGRGGADKKEELGDVNTNAQEGDSASANGEGEEQDKREGAGTASSGRNAPRTVSATRDGDGAGEEQSDGEDAGAGKEDGKECVQFVVYDKPVKTGSTAITQALKRVLGERGGRTAVCKRAECLKIAEGICAGKRGQVNLVQHMEGKDGVLECLRDSHGYYVATSIREPFARWESAFWYNKRQKATHFGISWEVGYEEFMRRLPACSMLAYFDGLDKWCGGEVSVDERVKKIVKRYDEIIDLFDEPRGMLEMVMRPYLGRKNESPRPGGWFRGAFDRRRLENETVLYEAMKKQRGELLRRPRKRLCR